MKLSGKNFSPAVNFLLSLSLISFIISILLFENPTKNPSLYLGGIVGLQIFVGGLFFTTTSIFPRIFPGKDALLFIFGLCLTITGYVTCFIPGIPDLLLLFLSIGTLSSIIGFVIFFPMIQSENPKKGSFFYWSTGIIAIFFLIFVFIWLMGINQLLENKSYPLLSFLETLVGCTFSLLAFLIAKKIIMFSNGNRTLPKQGISADRTMEMQYGLYMFVLGILLIPVNFGFLPYALNAIQGILVVILGLQLFVIGRLLSFFFQKSWITSLFAIGLIAAGTCAIAIPDLDITYLSIFTAILIIGGGLYLFFILVNSVLKSKKPASKVMGKELYISYSLLFLALFTGTFMIIFGFSMIIKDLISGFLIAFFLIFFGLSQFALIYVQDLEKKRIYSR